MFAGHYGIAFAAKKVDSRIPLWQLFLAVQFLDIVWAILVLLGVEKGRIDSNGAFDLFAYLPYSHGLLASLAWSTLIYALIRLLPSPLGKRSVLAALVLGAAVWSHFWLDLIAHQADLPLVWNSAKIGLGLSNSLIGEFIFETGLLGAGVGLYLASTEGTSVVGRYGAVAFAGVLVLINAANVFGSEATDAQSVAVIGLLSYLGFATVTVWIDRHRRPKVLVRKRRDVTVRAA